MTTAPALTSRPGLTERQKKMRMTGVGASESPAVLGESPFENDTLFRVWKRKVMPDLEPDEATPAMKFGNCVEQGIAEYYAAETGAKLVRSSTRRHPKHRFLVATPDRIVIEGDKPKRLVQAKSVGRTEHHWDMSASDGVPSYVRIQVQQEMEVAGLDECHVAALFLNGRDFKIFEVKREQALIDIIVDVCGDFWERFVKTGQVPPMDTSEAASKYLRERYPFPKRPELLPSTDEVERWAREYAAAHAQVTEAEGRKELAKNNLCALIGDGAGFEGPWGKATWVPDSTGKVKWKSVAEELNPPAELIEKHRSKPERKIFCRVK